MTSAEGQPSEKTIRQKMFFVIASDFVFNGVVSFSVQFYDNFFFTTFMVLYVIGVRCPRRQEQRSDTNQYGFTVMGHFLAFWRKDRRIETENRHDCWAIRYNVRFRGGGYDHSSSLDV